MGGGRVMRYEEIVEEQKERDAKPDRVQQRRKLPNSTPDPSRNKKSRLTEEQERAEREIESWRLENCCAVLLCDFDYSWRVMNAGVRLVQYVWHSLDNQSINEWTLHLFFIRYAAIRCALACAPLSELDLPIKVSSCLISYL